MSAYKQFTTKDIVLTPFNVNATFSFAGSQITQSDVGIEFYAGVNPSSNIFVSSSELTTGYVFAENTTGIYKVAKQLYYTNYLSSSTGDLLTSQSFIPGINEEGDRYVGWVNAPRFDNYLQSTLSQSRYFPTGSGAKLSVISIPQKLFGNNILPKSFTLSLQSDDCIITDDGDGNLISGSLIVGQIFYSHGIAVLTTGSDQTTDLGEVFSGSTNAADSLTAATIAFQSSYNIYENQYKCTINENELNYSQNPSLLSGSNSEYYNFATGSDFSPYITSVGLYNEDKELMAVAKVAKPIQLSKTTDTTFIISFDRV